MTSVKINRLAALRYLAAKGGSINVGAFGPRRAWTWARGRNAAAAMERLGMITVYGDLVEITDIGLRVLEEERQSWL